LDLLKQAQTNLEAIGVSDRIETMMADAGYFSRDNCSPPREQIPHPPHMLIAVGKPNGPVPKNVHQPSAKMMRKKLDDPANRQLYDQRSQMIEPIFGHIKANRGATRFMRRGLAACGTEWSLLATAHNLMKLRNRRLKKPVSLFAYFRLHPACA
jgi:hypothetical protein